MNVIVTDGYSGIGTEIVKTKVDLMKNRRIEMFAVGITKRIKDDELQVLSSHPVLFRLNDSKDIKEIVDSIIKQVCK